MKIGIDGRLWGETGVGRYIRNLVFELQEIDKENEYVLFVRKKDYEKVKFQISNFKFQIRIADIRWHTLEEQIKLPKILNRENLDLMHFPYFSVPVFYNKPFVVTIHDLIINHFPTGEASTLPLPLYQLKRLGYKFVIENAVRKAMRIIVPSKSVKDDLLKTYKVSGDKIVVTYEGIDVKVLSSKYKVLSKKNTKYLIHNTRYFLYVGNAYPHKNLDRLIEAFEILRSAQDDIELVLVGKDDYFYKKLSEKIEKEKIAGVVFKNDVSDEELATLYQNTIALVAPSLMEGFGLPVLEAMANGCLVIVSDIPSFKEVARGAVVYFDPYSVDDIKKKMGEVWVMKKSEKEKYIKLEAKRAAEFSWKSMAEATLSVYKSVAGQHVA